MKHLKYIYTTFVAVALTLGACETDLDKVTYDESQTVAAVLSNVEAENLYDIYMAGDSVKFNFTIPKVNYAAQITNNIQVDLAGNDFANAMNLSATINMTTVAIAADEFNNSLINLLVAYGYDRSEVANETFTFQFRVVSILNNNSDFTRTIDSNVVSSNITLFGSLDYPKLWVIGDYCGWSHDTSQFLYSENSDGIYQGMVVFEDKAANGWQLTPEANWNSQYGTDGEAETVTEPSTLILNAKSNIRDYGRYAYEFSFDTNTLELKLLNAYDSWTLIGDMTDGWGSDADLTLGSDSDGHYLATTLEVTEGQEFKFRANRDWSSGEVSPGSVSSYTGCGATNDNSNFIILTTGNCTIKWYFNQVKQEVVVTYN